MLTIEEIELISEVIITTPKSCYPCQLWMNRSTCYHQYGVRYMCGFDSEVEGKQKTDAIKQAVHNKRKGSKRKDTTFHAGYLHFFMSCVFIFYAQPPHIHSRLLCSSG